MVGNFDIGGGELSSTTPRAANLEFPRIVDLELPTIAVKI